MVNVTLIDQRVTEASVSFHPKKMGRLDIRSEYAVHTGFASDLSAATATVAITMEDTAGGQFRLRVVTQGNFTVQDIRSETDRKAANTKCFEELFPYAEGYIRQVADMAGAKGLNVPKPEFTFDDIQAFEPAKITS